MDHATMRKRGWSIQSDPLEGHAEDDLTAEEKKELLNSFPQEHDTTDGHDDGGEHEPELKRQKMDETTTHSDDDNNKKDTMLTLAKQKLSKWAARLFDPDRPRGLVQPPQIIPLNDEFLTAFGKREKEYDVKLGRTMEIEQEIQDESSSTSDSLYEDLVVVPDDHKKQDSLEGRKVKITNLAYTTSLATLEAACHVYGPLEYVNLLMDKEQGHLNCGRAYVTFESIESANACVEKLQMLEGRNLNVSIAPESTTKRGGGGGGGAFRNVRYWEKDISTKCFRCHQVGHMESDCPNAAAPKPCPLCAGLDFHDVRACPKSRICFKCGIPGHINRECTYARQNVVFPKRVVCGICFQSGHHRVVCRRRPQDAPSQDAKCFVCHKIGHFQCSEMKWFFGLDGITCFNCGQNGHHGYDCDRPGVDLCARDEELADKEIQRAEAISLADELERHRQGGRGRSRDHQQRDFEADRARAQSQPPRGSRPSNEQRRSSSNGKRGNRGYDTRR